MRIYNFVLVLWRWCTLLYCNFVSPYCYSC